MDEYKKLTPPPVPTFNFAQEPTPVTEPEAKVEETGQEEVNEHDDNLYGNSWEIIKYSGYGFVSLWTVAMAVLAGVSAWFFAQPAFIPLTVLGAILGLVAAIDIKTHLIKDKHTLISGVIILGLSVYLAATYFSWWGLLAGLIAVILVTAMFCFLVIFVGFGSGGDIKFSPFPTFLLAVLNPLLPAVWFFLALVFSAVGLVVSKDKKHTAFGAGMALALPVSLAVTSLIYSAAGMNYM